MSSYKKNVQTEISKKLNYSSPYYARKKTILGMETEMDYFPYNRFFRGEIGNPEPTIFDRKAGYKPIEECYKPFFYHNKPQYQNYCFQTAANTVYPCYPEFLDKYNDRQKIEFALNRKCIYSSP